MPKTAIIGGSGLSSFSSLRQVREHRPVTTYGQTSAPILEGRVGETLVYFLARHGHDHSIPPHRVNYRANIAALKELGVEDVMAITAVGGLAPTTGPRRIVIPDQIIDYTYGREHTFSDGLDRTVHHIDFTSPYSDRLRQELLRAAASIDFPVETTGIYGATQGPRLETAAEIQRMARDGCTIVGMTGMPEASLAREAGLDYMNCSFVVNWAAGIAGGTIDMDELNEHLSAGIEDVIKLTMTWLEQR